MGSVDVAVIGGGASGLAAAIAAARERASVAVIEADAYAGLPILATGNGRCNVSNAHLDPARYRHPGFFRAVAGDTPETDIAALLDSLGVLVAEEGRGRLYPITRRAASVRDALLSACDREGVRTLCGAHIERAGFDPGSDSWALSLLMPSRPLPKEHECERGAGRRALRALREASLEPRTLTARRAVIACGGRALETARVFGLPHLEERPALCPLACTPRDLPENALKRLDGLRVEGSLSLLRGGRGLHAEEGEVLFRSFGLSGIAVFDMSRRAGRGDVLALNLLPGLGESGMGSLLSRRTALLGAPTSPSWFDGMLARPLAELVFGASGGDLGKIARLCRGLAFTVGGTAEEAQAQVRSGGIALDALDPATLGAGRGVHVCGEAADMDADCGGYNLAWAWLSGMRAGACAARGIAP